MLSNHMLYHSAISATFCHILVYYNYCTQTQRLMGMPFVLKPKVPEQLSGTIPDESQGIIKVTTSLSELDVNMCTKLYDNLKCQHDGLSWIKSSDVCLKSCVSPSCRKWDISVWMCRTDRQTLPLEPWLKTDFCHDLNFPRLLLNLL